MKLVTQEIILPDRYSVPERTEEARNALALRAREVVTITSAESNTVARNVAVEIRSHIKDVEAARVFLTKPLLDAQALLMSLRRDHVAPLEIELKRLESLATDYALAERRRVEAAEMARREALAEAERVRLAAEDAARKAASRMTTDAGMEKALAAEQKAAAAEQAVQTIIAAPMPSVERARGQTFGKDLKWEVTDLMALVKSRPDLCKIEPKASAINSSCVPEMPNPPPGLRLWWEPRSTFTTR